MKSEGELNAFEKGLLAALIALAGFALGGAGLLIARQIVQGLKYIFDIFRDWL